MLTAALLMAAAAVTPDTLIADLEKRIRELAPIRERVTYTRVETETDLRDPKQPVVLERRQYRVRRVDGKTLELLISVNDAPTLNAHEEEPGASFDRSLATRFTITNVFPLPFACRSCYLVSFEPRGKQPVRRTMPEELFSRISGTMMIDTETGAIRWLDGRLTKPFSVGWFLGKVYDARLQMNQQVIHGVPMIVSVSIEVHYRKLMSERHRHIELTYYDFELKPEAPSP